MNIRIITASAGTGKTTRLAEVLGEAIRTGMARPEAIIATTFTKQAAAELQNRARTQLLHQGLGREAQALLTSRIGTVNSVCGSLVTDFSFELGLSPELRTLDEAAAALELQRSLATVVTEAASARLQSFRERFDREFDWQYEVQRLIEAARANGLDEAALAASAARSVGSLDECLGPVDLGENLDAKLAEAIDAALAAIDTAVDATATTKEYLEFLGRCRRHLGEQRLRWGDWANLISKSPAKKSASHITRVRECAARHIEHPRLREEMHELVRLLFDVAAQGLAAYQRRKHERGLLDFGDQEVLALKLLGRSEICEILREQLDLVLVDEFQDTSPLQLAIFLKLAALARQSVWVGDPKQAIYGFRGADPALMDAAIETLVSPSHDPDLVVAAVRAVSEKSRQVETLSTSHRSRPDLVALTNAVFVKAFESQGMPEERVRLSASRSESQTLGPAVTQLRLEVPGRSSGVVLAQALAEGVRALLGSGPVVWDRSHGVERPARPSDVAVLCRTNAQCGNVAEALGSAGLASVVARIGLLDTPEALLLTAGLRLWVDGRDRVAAATMVRWIEHPENAATFVEAALADGESVLDAGVVTAVRVARESSPDRDLPAAIDAIVDALDLRRLAAGWGNQAQRIANIDTFRAHAIRYRDERLASGASPSIVGFIRYLDLLVAPQGWGDTRQDTCSRVGSEDAVSVSTWHAAKGLEWPIVILFGLESLREPQAYGVHVLSDRKAFAIEEPLGGRWVHFWPNPYTTGNQRGPVKDAYERSAVHKDIGHKANREALRVLYVGWTRPRDRLMLAAQDGKLLEGILSTLVDIDPSIVPATRADAAGSVPSRWAGHDFDLFVAVHKPLSATVVLPHVEGTVGEGNEAIERFPASVAPSSAVPRAARLGEPFRLGAPIRWEAHVEADALGQAVHDFLAADDASAPADLRRAIASRLLTGYGVEAALRPERLLEMGDRLWGWTRLRFGETCRLRREWPVAERRQGGTVVGGTVDLMVEVGDVVAVVDHKSFGLAAAEQRKDALAGQLGCYADAVVRARSSAEVSTWVHLPFEGLVVQVMIP